MKIKIQKLRMRGMLVRNKFNFLVLIFLIIGMACNHIINKQKATDVSGEYYDWTKTMQPENPWVHDYNKTLVMKMFLCSRNADGNVEKVYLRFADVLEVVRKIDNLTLGIPKIVYLVGWQYNGHDSKYPAWGEVNESLKREKDSTALESLKWLITKAKSYHTVISLHINMIDAFQDSPLWSEYLAKDIIAKNKKGEPIKGEIFNGMQSYQLSYAQEWKLGYAQQRIDNLIKMIPELKEGGTIHIDAFHSMRASGINEQISPYLDISIDEEISTQRKIFRYWRNQGIDVTCEGGIYWLRKDPFIGLQAMSWHYDEMTFANSDWPKKPANFSSLPAQFSGYTAMQSENEIKNDPDKLSGLLEQFCLKLVPWYYKRNSDVSKGGTVIISEDEVICPILWKDKALVAFNRTAEIREKKILLPTTWVGVNEVQLFELTIDGLIPKSVVKVTNGVIYLSIKKNLPSVIMPI